MFHIFSGSFRISLKKGTGDVNQMGGGAPTDLTSVFNITALTAFICSFGIVLELKSIKLVVLLRRAKAPRNHSLIQLLHVERGWFQ